MQTEFARDLADQNRPIEEAAAERPGKPIRIRVHPMIFRLLGTNKSGQYRAWRDVHWTLELDSPAEAASFCEAMRAFFKALMTAGPEAVIAALATARKEDAA